MRRDGPFQQVAHALQYGCLQMFCYLTMAIKLEDEMDYKDLPEPPDIRNHSDCIVRCQENRRWLSSQPANQKAHLSRQSKELFYKKTYKRAILVSSTDVPFAKAFRLWWGRGSLML